MIEKLLKGGFDYIFTSRLSLCNMKVNLTTLLHSFIKADPSLMEDIFLKRLLQAFPRLLKSVRTINYFPAYAT